MCYELLQCNESMTELSVPVHFTHFFLHYITSGKLSLDNTAPRDEKHNMAIFCAAPEIPPQVKH